MREREVPVGKEVRERLRREEEGHPPSYPQEVCGHQSQKGQDGFPLETCRA